MVDMKDFWHKVPSTICTSFLIHTIPHLTSPHPTIPNPTIPYLAIPYLLSFINYLDISFLRNNVVQ